MDGISGASAVLGVLQVGFSLAQAICEAVKEYKGADDDLRKLARDIDRTLYVVSRLETLISEGGTNGSFDSNGLEVMKECHKHTEQIVRDLVLLLTKSGVSYKTVTDIKPSDLVVSRSNRVSWIRRIADVKEKREELKDIYLEVNTIINLRDAIQAMPGTEQAAKRAMAVESERRRRRRVQLRQNLRKDTTSSQRQPGVENTMDATEDHPISTVLSPLQKPHNSGERLLEASIDQSKLLRSNSGTRKGTKNDASNGKTAISNALVDYKAQDTAPKGNAADPKNARHKKANNKSSAEMEEVIAKLEKPTAHEDHLNESEHQQITHEAVIETFKHATKDAIAVLSAEARESLNRAALFEKHNTPGVRLQDFIKSEYAQKWTAGFGEWLPGTQLDFRMSSDMPKLGIGTSKSCKWPFRREKHSSLTTLNCLGIPDRACFLVIEQRFEAKGIVTRLNPPSRLKRANMRTTGLIWAEL